MKFVSPPSAGRRGDGRGRRCPHRDPAEVPAEVEAAGPVDARERVDRCDGETVDLERLVVRELRERADVPPRRDHEVAGRVRVLVQQRDRRVAVAHDGATRPPAARARDSAQKTQPSCSSACAMYSSRHGAQRGFVMSAFLPVLARRPRALVDSPAMALWAQVLRRCCIAILPARRARDPDLRRGSGTRSGSAPRS